MSQAHLDDITLIIDNDRSYQDRALALAAEHADEGPTSVGDHLLEWLAGDTEPDSLQGELFREFLSSVSAYDLGRYYLTERADITGRA